MTDYPKEIQQEYPGFHTGTVYELAHTDLIWDAERYLPLIYFRQWADVRIARKKKESAKYAPEELQATTLA